MKTLFIEARRKLGKVDSSTLARIPKDIKKIGLIYLIQYADFVPAIKKFFENAGKKAFIGGQVLGCDVSNAKKLCGKIDALLLISSGKFHAMPVALLGKPVFIFNPESSILEKITEEDIKKIKARKKSALLRFFNANKIGIIVSTKYGQYNIKQALSLKEKLEKKGKKAFIFICDSINEAELENFDCEAWINTACQALNMEPKILNINDVRV